MADTMNRWLELKEEMRKAAPSLGIDSIGVASADPFTALKDILVRHRELGRESGFEAKDLDKRTNPSLLHDDPKSIIAIAVAYPSKLENQPRSEKGARRGMMSRSSWGEDYHHVLRDRLAKLEEWLRERVPELLAVSMVDTGELVDRAVAERAGIGWSAKNCSIITPEWGSWVYLGEMITNLPLPPDTPITEGCGTCTLCIDACPTSALVGPGQLDATKCVSFLTQTKDMLDEPTMRKIGNRVYGCDICQIVCPMNKDKNWTHHPELQPDPDVVMPLLTPLLSISNKEFKERFSRSASSWRGKKPIQRNALIALGNYKEVAAVPDIIKVLAEDTRPVLRGTAAWALSRIGGEEAKDALRIAWEKESDEEAKAAMSKALIKLGCSLDEPTDDDHTDKQE